MAASGVMMGARTARLSGRDEICHGTRAFQTASDPVAHQALTVYLRGRLQQVYRASTGLASLDRNLLHLVGGDGHRHPLSGQVSSPEI